MSKNVQEIIAQMVHSNDVVLFMKGTRVFPQCGFSGTLANILDQLDIQYRDINVLDDDVLRQGIKEFSNWPTIPQLYVHGEFIGGCDIVREMAQAGELQQLFDKKGIAYDKSKALA